MAWLTDQNPVLCASTAAKLKYVPFGYYMNYDFVRYLWADICLLPHTPKHYSKWDGPHSIKHEPIWIQITILVPSLAHTISYIFISEYSLITCSDTCMHFPKHSSRDCTNCLFLIYPYYYYYSSVFPHSQRWRCVSVFTSICPMLYSIKQYSINSFTAHLLPLFVTTLNFCFQIKNHKCNQIDFRMIAQYLFDIKWKLFVILAHL